MAKHRLITNFRPQIRSRHPSHNALRNALKRFPFRVVVRLGSLTEFNDGRLEINTIKSIKQASNKMIMKGLFTQFGVPTSKWQKAVDPFKLSFPVVAKLDFRSKGKGMVKIDDAAGLKKFMTEFHHLLPHYYFEEYFPTGREFRIHVSQHLDKEIYSVRKMMDREAQDRGAWSRNIANGYFVEEFERPSIWNEMVKACILACRSVGLDIGACDVLYSVKKNTFVICEINSAPSLGEKTAEAYTVALEKIIEKKHDM